MEAVLVPSPKYTDGWHVGIIQIQKSESDILVTFNKYRDDLQNVKIRHTRSDLAASPDVISL
jgi:hypothetical protein